MPTRAPMRMPLVAVTTLLRVGASRSDSSPGLFGSVTSRELHPTAASSASAATMRFELFIWKASVWGRMGQKTMSSETWN
jgi:hypothetical protein